MLKRSILFVLLVAIVSLASSIGWAQPRPFPIKKVVRSNRALPKNNTSLNTQILLRNQSPRILMGETALKEKQIRERCLQKAKQTQQRIYEEELAKHPPIIGEKIQTNSAKLMFRGKKIGVLKRGESIIMGSAYDKDGRQVVHLESTTPNGNPLFSTELENALRGYGIETVMLMIRSSATPKKRAQTRLLTYRVSTGEVTEKISGLKK